METLVGPFGQMSTGPEAQTTIYAPTHQPRLSGARGSAIGYGEDRASQDSLARAEVVKRDVQGEYNPEVGLFPESQGQTSQTAQTQRPSLQSQQSTRQSSPCEFCKREAPAADHYCLDLQNFKLEYGTIWNRLETPPREA